MIICWIGALVAGQQSHAYIWIFTTAAVDPATALTQGIDNPIFATTATGQTGVFGGVPLTNAIVSSFGNGDKAKLSGVEFAFQKPLTFLPSSLDGLGVNANLTLTDGELEVPGRTVKTPLVGQADKIASVQVY